MLYFKLETWDEVKSITLFHLVGFTLEWFKTSGGIQSWSYPEEAYTKIGGVPLFAGFMYAAVGSYIIQAWRLFDLKIKSHPPYWLGTLCALAIYINFSLITISATIAGISQPLLSAYTPGRQSCTRPMTPLAKCHSCLLSS